MISLFVIGFLIGMRHALEADHLAAVATLATHTQGIGDAVKQGAVWGLGHTLTLFLFGAAVLLLDTMVPEKLAYGLEFVVGLMLIGLGLELLWRLQRQRIHFHTHRHSDDVVHFHAHSHQTSALSTEHQQHPAPHQHNHPSRFPLRALIVGLMHGMAGSAALILLTLQNVPSFWSGLLYIALFGLGSVLGMALLAVVIAVPLRYSAQGLTWLHNGLQITVSGVSILIGAVVLYEVGPLIF